MNVSKSDKSLVLLAADANHRSAALSLSVALLLKRLKIVHCDRTLKSAAVGHCLCHDVIRFYTI